MFSYKKRVYLLELIGLQEVGDDTEGVNSVVVEVDVVAGVRVQVGSELGIFPDRLGRLLENALALPVADNVVVLSRDCLVMEPVVSPQFA